MKLVKWRAAALMCAALILLALPLLASCSKEEAKPERKALIKSPNIIKDGTLKVGVNLGFAPYAVDQGDVKVGLDADVAQFLSQKLGLYPEFVAIDPDEADSALADGKVDVVLSVPMDDGNVTVVGPYADGGVAYYTASGKNAKPADITAGLPVGVQKNSVGYWKLVQTLGADKIKAYKTDAELISALSSGAVKFGALDSVVGQYATAGGAKITLVDYVDGKTALGVGVSSDKQELAAKVKSIMSNPANASVLSSINRKWLSTAQKEATNK